MVEAEDLVHHVGLGLHGEAEHGEGLAAAAPERHLPGQQRAPASGPAGGPADSSEGPLAPARREGQ